MLLVRREQLEDLGRFDEPLVVVALRVGGAEQRHGDRGERRQQRGASGENRAHGDLANRSDRILTKYRARASRVRATEAPCAPRQSPCGFRGRRRAAAACPRRAR